MTVVGGELERVVIWNCKTKNIIFGIAKGTVCSSQQFKTYKKSNISTYAYSILNSSNDLVEKVLH